MDQERKTNEKHTANRPTGGVQSTVKTPTKDSKTMQQTTNFFRKKNVARLVFGEGRRISCKDLGGGDCQGWLWKKKQGSGLIAGRWVKYWFVLNRNNLYFYKEPEDTKAQGVIQLSAFTVSPAYSKSKKYAFKVFHSDAMFHFAAERQDDMAKWMNKLYLATLLEQDTSGYHQPSADSKSDQDDCAHSVNTGTAYYSESDDETLSPSTHDATASHEDITDLYHEICSADLNIAGESFNVKRTSLLRGNTLDVSNDSSAYRLLLSLRRSLADKEQQLRCVERLLTDVPITSTKLLQLCRQQPTLCTQLYSLCGLPLSPTNAEVNSSSSDSDEETQ